MAEVVWTPDEEALERANVVRLMRRHGIDDYWELVRRSQDDPEWFWPALIEDTGLEFSAPWDCVYDDSRGPEWTTWFPGSTVSSPATASTAGRSGRPTRSAPSSQARTDRGAS